MPAGLIPKGGYHSAEIRRQVENFHKQKDVDQLLVGSSIAAVNLSPEHLDAELKRLGGIDVSTYNAGMRGCNYACIAIGANRYYLSERTPKKLIAVINPVDVDQQNTVVIGRSDAFIESFERSDLSISLRNLLADVSHTVGFQAEVKQYIKKRKWKVDSSVIDKQGHVDMGSRMITRYDDKPRIDVDGNLSQDFLNFVEGAASKGIEVIVAPAYGHSFALANLSEESMEQFQLLLSMADLIENVRVLPTQPGYLSDSAYIDNLHTTSQGSIDNSVYLARLLSEGAHESSSFRVTAENP